MSLVEVQYQAHRAKISVTPQTTIIQVLDDSCAKFCVNPLNFELKHGTKRLDLSARFGMSGLPNNAKLELIKLDVPRNESLPVVVVVQTENGQRLRGEYPISTSIFTVLADLQTSGKLDTKLDDEPVAEEKDLVRCVAVVYARDEVIGKFALERTTLKHLGVISGTALLRVVVRRIEARQLTEIRQAIEKREADRKRFELESKQQQSRAPTTSTYNQTDNSTNVSSVAPAQPLPAGSLINSPASGFSVFDNPMTSGVSMFDNSVDLSAMGGWSFDQNPSNKSSASASTTSRNQVQSRTLGDLIGQSLESNLSSDVQMNVNEFANFKFPEETRGMNLIDRNDKPDATSSVRPVDDTKKSAVDREAFCYSLSAEVASSSAQSANVTNLPDNFFAVTESDVRRMLSSLRKDLSRLQEEPLMTKELRNKAKEERAKAYRRCIIRVHFADRSVLQGAFAPGETVGSLYSFVQSHLADSRAAFYLYTSPPKRVLENYELSLVHADLVPLSVVYCTVAPSESNTGQYLKNQLLEEARTVSPHDADMRAMRAVWNEDDFKRLLEAARSEQPEVGNNQASNSRDDANAVGAEDNEDGGMHSGRTVHVAGSSWKQSSSTQIGQSSGMPKWFKPK